MEYNWNSTVGLNLGLSVTYTCLASGSEMVHLDTGALTNLTTITCSTTDGTWDDEITSYDCRGCADIPNPSDGQFTCETKNNAPGSRCNLNCNGGMVPAGMVSAQCLQTSEVDQPLAYDWEFPLENYQCAPAITLVIGGIDNNHRYLNDVEIFAPGYKCHGDRFAPLPYPLIGAVSAVIKGSLVVCGGATMTYKGCGGISTVGGTGRTCGSNSECTETAGKTKWCTGPVSKTCYAYHIISKTWSELIKMRNPRVFASHVILNDGRLWILGGIGKKKILDTTEILEQRELGQWYVTKGPTLSKPRFGHCSASLSGKKVLLAGGHDSNDYTSLTEEYDWETGEWSTRDWSKNKHVRFDHACFKTEARGESVVYAVGGWNIDNDAGNTEAYTESLRRWDEVGTTNNKLPLILRSAGIGKSAGKDTLLGGSNCTLASSMAAVCSKTAAAFELVTDPVDPALDEWVLSGEELQTPRSSHITVIIPKSLVFGCNPEP